MKRPFVLTFIPFEKIPLLEPSVFDAADASDNALLLTVGGLRLRCNALGQQALSNDAEAWARHQEQVAPRFVAAKDARRVMLVIALIQCLL